MRKDDDAIPTAWWVGLLLLIPTAGYLIYLAMDAVGYAPPRAAEDEAVRDAMDEIGQAMIDAERVDFRDLPRDLTTLGGEGHMPYLFRAFEACGQVDLSEFEGDWRASAGAEDWADPQMSDGRFRAGELPRMELCPVHVVERAPGRLLAVAMHHEDVNDPGDAHLTYLEVRRRDDVLELRVGDDRDQLSSGRPVELRAAR